jgi:hypothetical protein
MQTMAILAEFQAHLIDNLGKPINLSTIAAFSKMMYRLLSVTKED